MDDKHKRNRRILWWMMLMVAVMPLFMLPLPLLPRGIRNIILPIGFFSYLLVCFGMLLWGGAVMLRFVENKFVSLLLLMAWMPLCTLLCWGWGALVLRITMGIYGCE